MILTKYDAVIFDLDGTLVDSMWMWKTIDIEYLARFDIPMPDDLQKAIEGMSFNETAVYFKSRFGIKDSLEKIKSDWNEMAYHIYKDRVKVKNGVVRFLEILKANKIKIGVATSNSSELTQTCFESLGISHYFDSIVTGSDVKKGKPDPEIYLKNAENLNVLPNKCLVFEDIPVGLLAGKSAGMDICCIYDDYSKDVIDEKKQLSDYDAEDFEDFINKYIG